MSKVHLEPVYIANVALYVDRYSTFETLQKVSQNCIVGLEILHINPQKLATGIDYLFRVIPNLNTLCSSIEYAKNELIEKYTNKIRWIDASGQVSDCSKIPTLFNEKINKIRILGYDLKNVNKYESLEQIIVEQLSPNDLCYLENLSTLVNLKIVVLYSMVTIDNSKQKFINVSNCLPNVKFSIVLNVSNACNIEHITKNLNFMYWDYIKAKTRIFNTEIYKTNPIKEEKVEVDCSNDIVTNSYKIYISKNGTDLKMYSSFNDKTFDKKLTSEKYQKIKIVLKGEILFEKTIMVNIHKIFKFAAKTVINGKLYECDFLKKEIGNIFTSKCANYIIRLEITTSNKVMTITLYFESTFDVINSLTSATKMTDVSINSDLSIIKKCKFK
ncbi:hypothetical protein EIN_100510, partial [Entamoeba invadens IP1]